MSAPIKPPGKKRPTWIPVVTGILRRRNEVLLGKRPSKGSLGGFWEFPGGKIEKGERPEVALVRELKEELEIDAKVGRLLMSSTHFYGDTGIILLIFEIDVWKGEPKTRQHQDLQWVPIDEVSRFELPEANLLIWQDLKKLLEPKK